MIKRLTVPEMTGWGKKFLNGKLFWKEGREESDEVAKTCF